MSITLALVLAQTEFVHATWLNYTWYAMLGVLLVGYAILDGFDLGVGILHAFVPRTDLTCCCRTWTTPTTWT